MEALGDKGEEEVLVVSLIHSFERDEVEEEVLLVSLIQGAECDTRDSLEPLCC